MQTEHGIKKTKTQTFPGEETAAATAWSMPTCRAVDKEIIRDNSAQREDPVAKELRFDPVTKKMNKNHRRPIYGDEATTEEERQKNHKTREGAKHQRRRTRQREQTQERQRRKKQGTQRQKGREAREPMRGTRGRHSWKEAEAVKRRIRKRHPAKKTTERIEATEN